MDKVVVAVRDGELIKTFASCENLTLKFNDRIKDICSTKTGIEFMKTLEYESKEPFTLNDFKERF